jgi:hypothetical protein
MFPDRSMELQKRRPLLSIDTVGEYSRCWVLGTKDQIPTRSCGSYELLRTPTDPTIPNNPTEFFR